MENLIPLIQKIIHPLRQKLFQMITMGRVEKVSDKTVQISFGADDIQDEIARIEPFGLTSIPPVKSQAVCLFLNGSKSHPLAICVDDPKTKPNSLKSGEVALYNASGSILILKENGKCVLSNQTTELFSVLCELVDALSQVAVGPTGGPLLPPHIVQLNLIKTKLETFKS